MPVTNYECAFFSKITEFMAESLTLNLNLPCKYNITKTSYGAENIKKFVAQPAQRMITIDITYLHSDIPNAENPDVIKTHLQDNIRCGKR
jgi:hypothetical protein